ncbi:hypothetical protein ACMXYX_18025 (plasmid) [Neptuniibacter sp. QD72_48]|uniref:hypothetical protein n=1 Tax=Neptuniibacter sp. QD72_48 TaxID=3398214 RepID=UPI0039F5B7FF
MKSQNDKVSLDKMVERHREEQAEQVYMIGNTELPLRIDLLSTKESDVFKNAYVVEAEYYVFNRVYRMKTNYFLLMTPAENSKKLERQQRDNVKFHLSGFDQHSGAYHSFKDWLFDLVEPRTAEHAEAAVELLLHEIQRLICCRLHFIQHNPYSRMLLTDVKEEEGFNWSFKKSGKDYLLCHDDRIVKRYELFTDIYADLISDHMRCH